GTLFLDEIGDAPLATQLKLLRVLQEKCIERLGSSETIPVDVRVLAATNRDLTKAIAEKQFREDLYYRLNVVTLRLPPLRERVEDIPELVAHFVRKHSEDAGKKIANVAPECIDILSKYSWPGNIRELENCIQRAVILCQGSTILPHHIVIGEEVPSPSTESHQGGGMTLEEVERNHIARVLRECCGNQSCCARILGIDRKTLRNKIRQYGLGKEIAAAEPENGIADHR
ncbi:MAG: sigma 54-interacting transcriptional regulator, partial [Armatimonadota bacterium]